MRRELFIRTIVFAFALLTAAHVPAWAQGGGGASVAGRVTDAQGAGLPGASVTLYARERTQLRFSTTTDAAGAYRFERLAAGAYLVEAEAEGFAHSAAREVTVAREGTTTLDVHLEVAGVRAEVVVTAADSAQTVDEVSKAINVIGRGEIEERDEATIADALRTVPGLRVQQLGGPGALTSIKMRGLRSQDTALLIDGLRFRDPTAPQGDASGFLSDFVIADTGRIEILRGSGSSLYGTNAIGGVVNVVTEEGGGPFHGSLLAEGGSLGYARGRAQVSGSAGEADRLVFSAAFSHLNVARGVDGDDATRNTTAQGRVLLRLTPTASLSARLYASDTFAQLNEEPQAVGTIPASGIVDARPISRAELRRYESGAGLGQLNIGSATFLPRRTKRTIRAQVASSAARLRSRSVRRKTSATPSHIKDSRRATLSATAPLCRAIPGILSSSRKAPRAITSTAQFIRLTRAPIFVSAATTSSTQATSLSRRAISIARST